MEILRESAYVAVPWKNGGGITREILRMPPESTAFDWRLSLASIDAPGPFSSYDGYERTLILERGAGVELDFGTRGRVRLTAAGQLARFDGGWQTACTLLDGPCTDLNLIVSRERVRWLGTLVKVESPETTQTNGWTETLVCCVTGSARVTNMHAHSVELNAVDVARCLPGDGAVVCEPLGPATQVFIARLASRGTQGA
jgi:environmental stress-induced protein Ves